MSRWKIAKAEYEAGPLYCTDARQCDAMQGSEVVMKGAVRLGRLIVRLAGFAILCTLVLACCTRDIARAQTSGETADQPSAVEKVAYADALAYCRGNSPRPDATWGSAMLRADKRVLCFEGWWFSQSDILLANGLEHGGIFVVRSHGGDVAATIALANLLLLKDATVVIKDYCLQACADYLFVATARTFVPKDALVAWTLQASVGKNCFEFPDTSDPRGPHAAKVQCPGSPVSRDNNPGAEFYRDRVVLPPEPPSKGVARISVLTPGPPPQSLAIRRILKRKFDETGRLPDNTYWTWNPRYYSGAIKTKIFDEAYPQSQDELDAIVKRLGLAISVIYDP
jgi:hypothetical protein